MKQFAITLSAIFFLTANVSAQKFSVSFPDSLLKQPFTGNILLYLSKDSKAPKNGTVGLEMFPCFRVNVKNVKPGAAVIIDDNAIAYPRPLSDLERTAYYVQVVWDRDLGNSSIGRGAGNLYSVTQKVTFTKDFNKVFTLAATKVNPEPVFKETQYVKELKVPSALLSNFNHRPMTVNALDLSRSLTGRLIKIFVAMI